MYHHLQFSGHLGGGGPKGELTVLGSPGKTAIEWK